VGACDHAVYGEKFSIVQNVVSKLTPGPDANFSFTHAKTLNHPA
jgi:hypothetical protein